MLRTPSVFGPLSSGFVPFTSGAPIDAVEAETQAAAVIARASTPAVEAVESLAVAPRAAWAPASSTRIRVVEALGIAALCSYFAFCLLSTLLGH